jgi:hypothetical protein
MARTLNSFPALQSEQRYPWDEWLSGSIVQLTRGEDFASNPKTIVANARNQAKRRGGTVRTRMLGDSVVIQFRREV